MTASNNSDEELRKREQQQEIILLLLAHGARPTDEGFVGRLRARPGEGRVAPAVARRQGSFLLEDAE